MEKRTPTKFRSLWRDNIITIFGGGGGAPGQVEIPSPRGLRTCAHARTRSTHEPPLLRTRQRHRTRDETAAHLVSFARPAFVSPFAKPSYHEIRGRRHVGNVLRTAVGDHVLRKPVVIFEFANPPYERPGEYLRKL